MLIVVLKLYVVVEIVLLCLLFIIYVVVKYMIVEGM